MSWFQEDLTSLAFCWRLQRQDGVALGFTSHDRDIAFDGLMYLSAPGLVPSAIEKRDDLRADTVSLSGAITSDYITAADLDAGRWDGARLSVFAVDWTDPENDPQFLIGGELGGVESDGRSFSAELLGATTALDRPIVEDTSPECRATLGDKRCRVDLAGRTLIAKVTIASDDEITVDADLGADNDYAWGRLRWLDGANAGLSSLIVSSMADAVVLRERPPFPVASGTRIELTQGCDRRFATCRERFGNAANFRGEPHLPGNDLLVRYAR